MMLIKKNPIRSALKSFFAFWRPTLNRRLTVSFTIFGLLIVYAVFIILAASATKTFINLATDIVRQRISTLPDKDRSYELCRHLELARSDLRNSAKKVQGLLSDVTYSLYLHENKEWVKISPDQHGIISEQRVINPELVADLEKAGRNKVLTGSSLFLGVGDSVNVKINISGEGDSQIYIISFDVYRAGLHRILKDNIRDVLIFFAALLLVLRSIAYIFSIPLARPIEQLARDAAVIASGEYEKRFTDGRKDEIGILADALNNMAGRIIDDNREREKLLIGILIALTRAIDAKSPWTAGHSERVTKLAESIGSRMQLNEEQMRVLSISAILHDIGKIAVPEQILDKPERLDDQEYEVVRRHPQTGADIISSIPSYETILPGILHHHESWDGTGYPEGSRGAEIPLIARIICIADVYDALTADRPYRKAWGMEQTLDFFDEQKGKMFDPDIVAVFREHLLQKTAE